MRFPDRTAAGIQAARHGERGVVLILTLFVILITYALVTQLTLGTQVALQTTRNTANRIRMEAACRSVADQILQVLADDSGAAGGAMGGEAGGLAQGLPGGAAAGGDALGYAGGGDQGGEQGGGGEGEEEQGDDGSNSDSWEDAWSRPMRVLMGEMELTAWVQDENSKFNLLTMAAEDEELRDEARERCARILDRLREDFDDDLSYTDARRITDRIVQWLEGYDRSEDGFPRPPRHSNPEEGEICLPFALEELLLLEGVDETLYYDQLRPDEKIAPGLETVFTVWTSIDLEPAQAGPAAGEPGAAGVGQAAGDNQAAGAAAGGLDSLSGEAPAPAEGGESAGLGEEGGAPSAVADGGLQGALQGEPALGAKVNLNTVAPAVLRGLMDPAELSEIIVDELLEYRNEIDEEALAELESEEYDQDEAELERALYGEEKPEPRRYFKSLDDLSEIESLERLDQTTRQKLLDLVEVRSDVFSVYLFARFPPRDWRPEERYQEPNGAVLRLRAVVWRRNSQSGAKFIYLLPWHEVPYTRWRIPDFQERLEVFVPPSTTF